ncbi:MAG: CDGSH iron-sulfur domain-containing protein [Candidatus Micrarchaeia archaeon]
MARIVVKKEKGPVEVKPGEKGAWICRCGLTTNPPYCSGMHKQVLDEQDGKLFRYENGKRIEVEVKDKA